MKLADLAADVPASLKALDISERQVDEVHRNAALRTSETTPALLRYTGVLYDNLDFPSLKKADQQRAYERLAVASALFGVVRGGDPVPAYRLSGGSTLPSHGSLRTLWKPALEPVLRDADEFVVDLRSGAYSSLAKIPHAVVVRHRGGRMVPLCEPHLELSIRYGYPIRRTLPAARIESELLSTYAVDPVAEPAFGVGAPIS